MARTAVPRRARILIPSFCKPLPSVPNRDNRRPFTGQINPPALGGGGFTDADVDGARLTTPRSAGRTLRGGTAVGRATPERRVVCAPVLRTLKELDGRTVLDAVPDVAGRADAD